jgi:hypothetical protein
MSVEVDLHQRLEADTAEVFDDANLPTGSGGIYCFHVGAGGSLVILVDERGESRVERVYSPTAWRSARGDVWRKGALLR